MDYDSLAQGVDVSHWQSNVDWTALADAEVSFAYIKATQGFGEDPMFQTNATQADAAGILTLAYAFVTAGDTADTVANFSRIVGPSMPMVLDCEVPGITDAVATWVANLGKRPALAYVGVWPPFTPPAEMWALPRILPEYSDEPRLPAWDGQSTPDWSKQWLIWQRSQQGIFQGETGTFDLDVLAVSLERFKAWCETGVWSS